MSDYTYSPSGGGGGCLLQLAAVLVALFAILSLVGDHESSGNTTPVLSENEVFSRNQVNAWSDVTNNYLDCMGAYSCIVTDNGQVITTTTTINGARNTIVQSDGQIACENPNAPGQYGAVWCQQGVQP